VLLLPEVLLYSCSLSHKYQVVLLKTSCVRCTIDVYSTSVINKAKQKIVGRLTVVSKYVSSLIPLFLVSAILAPMLVQSAFAYDNAQYGFSITAPAEWTFEEGNSGTVVMFFGPVMPETGTNVNINVIVGNTAETLSEVISSAKNVYPTDFPNFTLVSESSRNIGGLNCYEIVYTFSDGGNDYKQKQVFAVENGQDFIITCTSTPSNYDTYLPTFEQSLQTFQLTSSSSDSFPIWIALVLAAIVFAVIVVAFVLLRKRPKS
jgi:hypothetical protein